MTSIGSVSFWQQDQNYWSSAQQNSQAQALSSTVINQMFGASTTLATGLASIANQTALDRVNTAAYGGSTKRAESSTAGVQPRLRRPARPASTASSSSSSSAASSAAAPIVAAPATGTGTVPLTSGTPLLGLGFLTRGNFTVSDGTYTTTYQSTGTDTVGDLINAINSSAPGNAQVTAWLNGSGNLVISSKNLIDTVSVSGDYAAALGFGSSEHHVRADHASSGQPSRRLRSSGKRRAGRHTSSSGSSSSASRPAARPVRPRVFANNSAFALQTGSTAELLLASSGSAGSLLNILA